MAFFTPTSKILGQFSSLTVLHDILVRGGGDGCNRCSIATHPEHTGCALYRGNIDSKVMIVGEGLGEVDARKKQPFTGPAGILLDQSFRAVGLRTNNFYLTNVVLGRPIKLGSLNRKPTTIEQNACWPFLAQQMRILQPRLVITVGKIATEAFFEPPSAKITDYSGHLYKQREFVDNALPPHPVHKVDIFPIIHPAALLHTTGTDTWKIYDRTLRNNMRNLKKIINDYISLATSIPADERMTYL